MPLTNIQIEKAKPGPKLVKLSDGGGLQLWIMPTGSKLWHLAYRNSEGKQKKLAYGPFPLISLAEARQKHDKAKRQLRQRHRPGATDAPRQDHQGAGGCRNLWSRGGGIPRQEATREDRGNHAEAPAAAIALCDPGPQEARLRLSYTRNWEDIAYELRLVGEPCRFGGLRWFAICPVTFRKVSKLYLPPGAKRFLARKAWRLSYASQNVAPGFTRLCDQREPATRPQAQKR